VARSPWFLGVALFTLGLSLSQKIESARRRGRERMEFSTLIDVDLWNRARWNGVSFNYQADRPPFLALAFDVREAGEQAFAHLHATTGDVDRFELIRIAFIEGDIPGKPPGYTVLISPNYEGIIAKARAEGREPPDEMAMVARTSRMRATPGSRSVPRFKEEFASTGATSWSGPRSPIAMSTSA
jgi:hypothetical protein